MADTPETPPMPATFAQELNQSFEAAFASIEDGHEGGEERTATGDEAQGHRAEAIAREVEPEEELRDLPEPTEEGDEGEGEGSESEESGDADEEYERALLALRYLKIPDKLIKNASREELIAWGSDAADRRAKMDAALEERAQRIRELEEGAKAPAKEAAKAPEADWSPHLKALADVLGLEPDAATQAFKPVLDAVADSVRQELTGRLSQHEKVLQEAQAAEGRRQISEQVRRLSEAHPKLSTDQDLVQKLNAKALALWKSGEYQDAASVYDDAARLVLPPPTGNLSSKRRNGASAPPEGREEDRSLNSDDAFLNAMERVEAGDIRGAMRYGKHVSWSKPGRR